MEDTPRDLRNVCKDVTSAGRVLAALQPRTELSVRVEDVQVVRADKVLRQADDRALQRDVAVVVRRVLGDVPRQLSDLRSFMLVSFCRPRSRRQSNPPTVP